jgi:hypothetical protein
MLRTTAIGLVTGLALLSAAPTFADSMIKDVEVKTDLDAIENKAAAARWANLSEDLQRAIVTQLVGKTAEDGDVLSVDIDEFELANSFQAAAGSADSRLVGRVSISTDGGSPTVLKTYDLAVSVKDASPYFPPGTDLATVTSDSQIYYDAMVLAFADHVVKDLD